MGFKNFGLRFALRAQLSAQVPPRAPCPEATRSTSLVTRGLPCKEAATPPTMAWGTSEAASHVVAARIAASNPASGFIFLNLLSLRPWIGLGRASLVSYVRTQPTHVDGRSSPLRNLIGPAPRAVATTAVREKGSFSLSYSCQDPTLGGLPFSSSMVSRWVFVVRRRRAPTLTFVSASLCQPAEGRMSSGTLVPGESFAFVQAPATSQPHGQQ